MKSLKVLSDYHYKIIHVPTRSRHLIFIYLAHNVSKAYHRLWRNRRTRLFSIALPRAEHNHTLPTSWHDPQPVF